VARVWFEAIVVNILHARWQARSSRYVAIAGKGRCAWWSRRVNNAANVRVNVILTHVCETIGVVESNKCYIC
jgi:hypothetical protein